jgi:hypothetical protein
VPAASESTVWQPVFARSVPEPRHVIGVDVRVERPDQREVELSQHLQVSLDLLKHRVDEHRLARHLIGQQVRVRRGLWIEQLSHQHGL